MDPLVQEQGASHSSEKDERMTANLAYHRSNSKHVFRVYGQYPKYHTFYDLTIVRPMNSY